MFERFTKEARGVVEQAQHEAAAMQDERIGAEHLLIALAAAPDGAAARVLGRFGLGPDVVRAAVHQRTRPGDLDADALASIGIDLEEVRRRVEATFGPGALRRGRPGRRPFTAEAKKAMELSLREALALGDNRIGSEHVLLGVVRVPGETVDAILRRHGHTPNAVREAVLAARAAAA